MRDEITKDLQLAFDTDLNDAVKPFEGVNTTQSESPDGWVDNDVVVSSTNLYSGRGVFSGYTQLEVLDESIKQSDVKLICLQSEVSREPQPDDEITHGNQRYQVVSVRKDPADVSFIIQLRGI